MEKTNENSGRRFGQLVISILVAIAVWIYVDVEKAPSVVAPFRDVPVEFAGENTVLADNNLMLLDGYDATIDLKLEGPRKELRKLDKDNIRLVVDTANITSTGVQTLRWNIYYPDTVSSNSVNVSDASAYTVTVTVGELFTKEVPVYCDVIGDAAQGYVLGTMKIDPMVLVLHAQREDLLDVSYAKVSIDVTDVTRTIVRSMNAVLYDYDDREVDTEEIRISNGLVQVTQPVYTTKEVPLKINFTGGAGNIGDNIQCSIYPASVTLLGEESSLTIIDKIVLETIDVQKLAATQKKNYTIKAPEGTSLLGEDTIATATITVTGTSERQLLIDDITLTNVAEDLEATVPGGLYVTVWGNVDDVAAIETEDVTVTADLSEINEAGHYNVSVLVKIHNFENVTVKGTYQVTVNVDKLVPAGPAEGGTELTEPAAPETPTA